MSKVEPIKSSGQTRRALTMPVLKQVDEKEFIIKILDKFRLSKAVNVAEGAKKMSPATICTVENREDGKRYTLIVNKVLEGILNEDFPGDGYIGKTIAFTRHPKAAGKSYHTYSVDVFE